MSRRADRTAAIVILIAVILAAASYLTASVGLFECGETNLAERPSPDGKVVATIIERNCGATTDYVTLVALRLVDQPPSADEHAHVINVEGRCDLSTQFLADTLVVGVPASCDAEQGADEWNGITIRMSPK